MTDTKISALATLTGANLATGDKVPLVDISDTTMAASGTDKSITAQELTSGVSLQGLLLPAGAGGATGSLASTYDRAASVETNVGAQTSAQLILHRILLPKGLPVTNITFYTMTTALGTGSNQWFALFDSSRNKLAVTADDTSTAWAANSAKTLAVTGGPFVTTYAGWHYLGQMVKATTMPTMVGGSFTGSANIHSVAPIVAGKADTGLTNPASCPSTAAALTFVQLIYGEVS